MSRTEFRIPRFMSAHPLPDVQKRDKIPPMTGFLFHANYLVADTSSLIYLAKASIIGPFVRAFHVTIPPSVYQECVHKGYPGSDEIRGLRQEGWLCVHPVREDSAPALGLPKGGEREVIILFYQLGRDGILIDDGNGVKACRRRSIPFVSALLIPSLLLMKKAIGTKEAEESMKKIVEIGRYSQGVIFFARKVLLEACRKDKERGNLEKYLLIGLHKCLSAKELLG